jgi:hypothetical protein
MDPSCASCSFLKSAFDTLLKSGEVVDAPSGKQTKYQIAILDRDDDDGADKVTARRIRAAARKSGASRSLKVVMRCSTKGGFQEEFKVEIYTPVGGEFAHVTNLIVLLIEGWNQQPRQHLGRPSEWLVKSRQNQAQ